jgi:hypothetical protein
MCADHQFHVAFIDDHKEKHKNYVVPIIKNYLEASQNAIGADARVHIAKQIFEFIYTNRVFVYNHENFANTIISKLYEFEYDQPEHLIEKIQTVLNPMKYIKLIFPHLGDDVANPNQLENNDANMVVDNNQNIEITPKKTKYVSHISI